MNKRLLILTIMLSVNVSITLAQANIERYVLSQGGGEGISGTANLSSTLGEPIIYTLEGPANVTLSQGFQQRVSQNASTKIELQSSFSLWPNPVEHELSIQLDNPPQSLSLLIYDISGKLLKNHDFGSMKQKTIKVDVQFLPPGIYLLELNLNGREKHRTKMIKRP
ncbi:MAG: T9SS type A sorting domain-containing protein [Bacteroidota bacterium]